MIIPEGVYEIADDVFKGCRMSSVILPEGLEVLGNNAFLSCHSLEGIRIPDSVYRFGEEAFIHSGFLNGLNIDSVLDAAIEHTRAGGDPECQAILTRCKHEELYDIGDPATKLLL